VARLPRYRDPQREIAILAAAGLTNKQIGERLYLFPKLGVTSRAALRDALSSTEDREEADT
jgi:DNA-binding NarL/FixJ family response regulator